MSDAVSRAAVLDILSDEGWLGDSLRRIRALPAVQPEPRLKPFDCECGQVGPCKAQFCTPRSAQSHVNKTPKSEHWPDGLFHLTGDTLGLRCATAGCGQHVSTRYESDGIGSDYCEPCGRAIATLFEKDNPNG